MAWLSMNREWDLNSQPADYEVNDIDFDGKNVIVAGSARSLRQNISMGMVIKLDCNTGEKLSMLFIGNKEFGSMTSLRRVQTNSGDILFEAEIESRLLFLFKRKAKKFYRIYPNENWSTLYREVNFTFQHGTEARKFPYSRSSSTKIFYLFFPQRKLLD